MVVSTIKDFFIIIPDPNKWYETMDKVQKLKGGGWSVLLLDRFYIPKGEAITISEEKMNTLGWYRK